MRSWAIVGVLASTVALSVAACGSSGSEFNKPSGGISTTGGGNTPGGGVGTGGLSDAGFGSVDFDAACATSSAGTSGLPLYLVFMFDRSGSMKDNNKWTACSSGLASFFGDANSSGLHASLQMFMQPDECNETAYSNPAVSMTTLPNGPAFQTIISATQPAGETPTLPALKGALAYAQTVKSGLGGNGKVAVVLVTDGLPNGCQSSIQNVAAAAQASAANIPTYVIGVGDALTNLDAIAAAGGTTKAIVVSTTNPAQITADLVKALGQVKDSAASCEYAIPKPPNGDTVNYSQVNVLYTAGDGTQYIIGYSDQCANPIGWSYDNAAAPTKLILCPGVCASVKNDPKAKIQVLFGCSTTAKPPS